MDDLFIRQADQADHMALVELWRLCFPDDAYAFPERFLKALPRGTVALIGEKGYMPVTMLFLLPAQARIGKRLYPVRYLYAGCTHPHHRSKGYYRQLMDVAAHLTEELGENAIFLHPADETLSEIYRRMGYQSGISSDCRCQPTADMYKCDNIKEYLHCRQKILNAASQQTVIWEVASDITNFFLFQATSNNIIMLISSDAAMLTADDTVIEHVRCVQDHSDDEYCLWLPIGHTKLVDDMRHYGGYTGTIGE